MTDAQRIDWLEKAIRASRSGITIDWIPSVDGESSGFRFLRRFFIGAAKQNIRSAIDDAIEQQGQFK